MRVVVSIVAALVVLGGVVAIVYGVVLRAVPVVQPIAFNHAVHIDGAGLQCTECHTDAETAVRAGLPGKAICFDCHDVEEIEDVVDPNPEKTKLFAFQDSDQDIPWRRVAVTKPDVFFSHRRHVHSARMDCLQCHRDQPTLTSPPSTAQLVLTMDECIECHEENGASTDCLACHR